MLSEEKNGLLRNAQEGWSREVLFPYANDNGDKISKPFFCGVCEEYAVANKKIMIIGQETRAFHKYSDASPDWLPNNDKIQLWCVDYLRFQVFDVPLKNTNCNASPFWQLFRKFQEKGISPCWNNIDKVQQYDGDKVCGLNIEQRELFSKQYGEKGNEKSLLQREIQIVEPDVVLFVTGPRYRYRISMSAAFGINEFELERVKPCKHNYIVDVNALFNTEIKVGVFWTYHPAYLNRIGKLNECVDYISKKIK